MVISWPPWLVWLIFIAVFILPGCKTAKRTVDGTVQLKPRSTKFLLKKLADNRFEADWLISKARITYSDDNETRKVTANIRMRKDSLIWMNVKKASVEAARIQITPDSLYVIDRLNKQFAVRDILSLEEDFNLPRQPEGGLTTFQMLQEMLLGNPIFLASKGLESGVDQGEYTLAGENNDYSSNYRVDGLALWLNKMAFQEKDSPQKFEITMERKLDAEEYPDFSYFRTFKVNSQKTGEASIKVKFFKVEINEPKTIRFSIPDHYSPME